MALQSDFSAFIDYIMPEGRLDLGNIFKAFLLSWAFASLLGFLEGWEDLAKMEDKTAAVMGGIGRIGLVVAVPFITLIAVYCIEKYLGISRPAILHAIIFLAIPLILYLAKIELAYIAVFMALAAILYAILFFLPGSKRIT